ncbi:hypothetical protein AB205_0190500, partial [Aquarana catesbeiana]
MQPVCHQTQPLCHQTQPVCHQMQPLCHQTQPLCPLIAVTVLSNTATVPSNAATVPSIDTTVPIKRSHYTHKLPLLCPSITATVTSNAATVPINCRHCAHQLLPLCPSNAATVPINCRHCAIKCSHLCLSIATTVPINCCQCAHQLPLLCSSIATTVPINCCQCAHQLLPVCPSIAATVPIKCCQRASPPGTYLVSTQLSALVEWGYSMEALNGKEKNCLVPRSCRIPIIYTLPKIHKDVRVPPARPIVNGIGSGKARLGEFLDKSLQPSVKATRAYLKDTTDLLRSLQEVKFDPTSEVYLVTADVASLYTIIQHKDAALALNWALSKRDDIPHVQKVFVGHALDFCMTHNYFWYDGHFFSQKVGGAMGAKYAPSLANLFLAEWEDRWVFNPKPAQLRFYHRFIDDLLLIWEGSRESAIDFISFLNNNSNNIRLDHVISDTSVNFLDVTLTKINNTISTKVYFKMTDRNSYLSIRSGHHPNWIKNIPKGQMLRVRRNCSDLDTYAIQANILKERFLQKGYKGDALNNIIQEVANIPREE